ncbi:MAG: hypothetical protein GF315_12405 [candidate division Zixibacteria bacterium]|nr:hypothetical protein [candidate division Zixibacteria bacterium]
MITYRNMFSACTLIMALLFSGQVYGAVSIDARVDKNVVSFDDQVTLTLNVNADARSISNPEMPEIKEFEIYSSGSSQSYNFINGEISSSVTYTYVIAPYDTGNFVIPPFSVRVQGREYKSDPINIRVVDTGQKGKTATKSPQRSTRTKKPKSANDKLFITAELNKRKAYVNEQVILTFKFYQAIRIRGNPELEKPSFDGFWIEDLPPQKKYYEHIDGTRYYVVEIKTALFPTSPGEKEIDPFKLTIMPDEFSTFFGRDPFDAFFNRRKPSQPEVLYSNRLKLDVKPLPVENKPANFTGAVGQFSLRAAPDVVEVEVNEPINYTITITGSGNIKAVDRPELNVPPEFRSYPSNASENINKNNYRLGGTRVFEEVLIPKSPGTFELSPVRFSYFDPDKEKYIRMESKSYSFKVNPSSVAESENGLPSAIQDIGTSVKDLRYLKTDLSVKQSRVVYYNSPVFWVLQALPIFAVFGVLALRKRKDKMEGDIAYARSKRAKAVANKVLKSAREYLNGDDQRQFYQAISKALTGYIADKLSVSASGLTTDTLKESLNGKVPESTIKESLEILRTCDFYRFASIEDTDNQSEQFVERVQDNIMELEKSFKK